MRLVWLVKDHTLDSNAQLNLISYHPSLTSLHSSPTGFLILNYARLVTVSGALNMLFNSFWVPLLAFILSSFDDVILISLLLSFGV